ncbi:hypothetical protein GM418_22295 [Maribellus comscasis]|uniref:Uncharacterized protein n=1 Tax=Maribellus comscasis TaxID=2681766 RepID=A0A6I6K1J1_9BACT|nr:hypothetical protein [Maribellus comscasis]QGY46292.1 hypothetical protein GM418_22295 [Maribellus comscasis]
MTVRIFFCFFMLSGIFKASDTEKQIVQFINNELQHYPEAQLADLYKNYFQDAYGPGHLIPDTTQAGKYLDWELKQPGWTDTLPYQALGINHDYYRINLQLVKNGTIPRDTLLLAMVESATLARNPDLESWKKEWNEVLAVIKKVKPKLPGMKSDEKLINQVLSDGDVVMHHSENYEELYHPHYRIVHRSVFERWKGNYLAK